VSIASVPIAVLLAPVVVAVPANAPTKVLLLAVVTAVPAAAPI